ncbi:MAG: hypothetical protein KDA41_19950 [Planctomycetales bacterium]|nr:hypothetical protein [Planctomycetales bacterium]
MCFSLRPLAPAVLVFLVVNAATISRGDAAETSESKIAAVAADAPTGPLDLFAAMEAGSVEATFIPRDSRRATIQLRNKTDQPLSVRLPAAFAGTPVLAQIGGPGGFLGGPGGVFGGGGGGAGGGGPQAVGSGFPAPGGGPAANPFAGMFGAPGGVMNIPPGKVLKVKRATVCLEHGKPEPGPRIAYRIVPLEEACADPAVRELMIVLANDAASQRVVQAAAWRLANDKSWDDLEQMAVTHINGQRTPWFTPDEIAAARKLVAALPSQRGKPAPTSSASSSGRPRS